MKNFLLKIKYWWKFIVFILIFFSTNDIVKADSFNFDALSNGQKINLISEFASSSDFILVSNATSSSPSNSLALNSTSLIFYNSDVFLEWSFNFNLDETENDNNCITAYFYNKSEYLVNLTIALCNGTTKDDIVADSNSSLIIKNNGELSNDWHNLGVVYDAITQEFSFYVDSVLFGSTLATKTSLNLNFDELLIQGLTGYNSFLDDLTINNLSDTIFIEEPSNGELVSFQQPTPFLFQYYNPENNYNQALIVIERLSIPAFSLSPLFYDIATTTKFETGLVSLSLSSGDYRVRGYLYNSLTDTLSSPSVWNNFTVSSSTIPTGKYPDFPLEDLANANSTISTTTIHNMVCTEGEWNSADPIFDWGFGSTTLPFFNLTKVSCIVQEKLWLFGSKVSDILKSYLEVGKTALSVVFPFNIPSQIYSSWVASEDKNLPSSLSLISDYVDASGNISITIPVDYEGQASSTEITFFGPSVFREPPNGSMDKACSFIFNLSTILQLGVFVLGIWALGKNTYKDLVNIKKEDTI